MAGGDQDGGDYDEEDGSDDDFDEDDDGENGEEDEGNWTTMNFSKRKKQTSRSRWFKSFGW